MAPGSERQPSTEALVDLGPGIAGRPPRPPPAATPPRPVQRPSARARRSSRRGRRPHGDPGPRRRPAGRQAAGSARGGWRPARPGRPGGPAARGAVKGGMGASSRSAARSLACRTPAPEEGPPICGWTACLTEGSCTVPRPAAADGRTGVQRRVQPLVGRRAGAGWPPRGWTGRSAWLGCPTAATSWPRPSLATCGWSPLGDPLPAVSSLTAPPYSPSSAPVTWPTPISSYPTSRRRHGGSSIGLRSRLVEMATQPPMVRATGQRSAWKPSTRSIVGRCDWSAASR